MPVYGIYMLFSFPLTCFREFSLQKSALRQPILLSTTGILLSLCKLVCRSVALVAFPSDFFDSSFFFDFSIFFSMFFNSRYSSRSRSVCVLSYCCEAKPAAFGVLSDCLAGRAWPNDYMRLWFYAVAAAVVVIGYGMEYFLQLEAGAVVRVKASFHEFFSTLRFSYEFGMK